MMWFFTGILREFLKGISFVLTFAVGHVALVGGRIKYFNNVLIRISYYLYVVYMHVYMYVCH